MNSNKIDQLFGALGSSTTEAFVRRVRKYRYNVIYRIRKKFYWYNFFLGLLFLIIFGLIYYYSVQMNELRVAVAALQENVELCNTPQKIDHYYLIDDNSVKNIIDDLVPTKSK